MAKDDWNEIDLENRRPPSVQSPDFFGRRWSSFRVLYWLIDDA
jgi:hypothetical protein